ncbi:hypothetical protein BG015_011505 [Linnemannia schmuckeri]|uniref:F-box domain-containing protein n=1 Tax=Linnemannia schmuckeri TaxID=64567 RepID=A0A9P5RUM0_9FUNG|nr:hypothetical protein BG015_011505 [Linnemannia schmuckeri]
MPPPSFFDIPELVYHTLTYLDKRSLLSFALASRHCHQQSSSLLARKLTSRAAQLLPEPPATENHPLSLPPLTRLHHFKCDLLVHNTFPGQLPVPEFRWQDLVLQTCWLLQLNRHLTSVVIDRMTIRTAGEWNRLSQALAGLEKLSELVVGPLPIVNEENGGHLLRLFFDSLPVSLTSLTISQVWSGMQDESDDVWQQRRGNLTNLRSLGLDCPEYFTIPFLRYILERCPVLEKLEILKDTVGRAGATATELARSISSNCPALDQVYVAKAYEPTGSHNGVMTILTSLSQQPLRAICLDRLEGARPNRSTRKTLKQHRAILQDIRLLDCRDIEKRTYMRLFTKCNALERLEIKLGEMSAGGLRIRHLVRKDWICQSLTYLEIPIEAPAFQDASYTRYFRRKFSPVRADLKEWQGWIGFYWRLGHLRWLRTLNLRRSGNETLPAMLALGNIQKEELGYLQLLRNLKELRELRGPFHLTLPEVAASFGKKEVMWMLRNWPNLRMIELLRPEESVDECLERFPQLAQLVEAKPWLELY